ncbi:MAG: hypothetical protein JWN22_268 [Nocardioides sp.]|jgi:hypothetical protein|nr:hypothetical protein [Nocardioides sp.]
MSYGVIASKAGHLSVEDAVPRGSRSAQPDAVDRFRTTWGSMWVPGRLTLTSLHLTFMPHSTRKGVRMLELNVADITGADLSPGMVSKTITLRVSRHALRFRCLGAQHLTQDILAAAGAGQERAHLANDR